MTKLRPLHKPQTGNAVIIIAALVLLLAIGSSAYFVFSKGSDQPSAVQPVANAATNDSEEANTGTKPLKTITNDKFGVSFKIPSDWTENSLPQELKYTAQDKQNNVEIVLTVSTDTGNAFTCPYIQKDSEEITYAEPLEGQRTSTTLSFGSKDTAQETLCGVMVTGSYKTKKGASFSIKDPAVGNALPTLRIVANIHNLDFTTEFPNANTVYASGKYKELVDIIKSFQIK